MTTIEKALEYSKTPEYVKPLNLLCPGCAMALAYRYFLKVVGEDKVIMLFMPGCANANIVATSPIQDDVMGSLFGTCVILAAGLKTGFAVRGDTDTMVVPWAGDGATFDIGMGPLSAAAERNDDILYVCYDNESYQNTGNQRSSAAPWNTTNTTSPLGTQKMEFKKDIMSIMAAHMIPYAATATVDDPSDLMRKVQKAKGTTGFRFLHILCPCPTGWGYPSDLTVELSRLAVDTKLFPIFEVENGVNYTINRQPKGIPVSEYTKLQRRWRHLTDEDLLKYQKHVDERWERLVYLAGYKSSDDGGQAK